MFIINSRLPASDGKDESGDLNTSGEELVKEGGGKAVKSIIESSSPGTSEGRNMVKSVSMATS